MFAVTGRPLIDPKGRVHSLCHVTPDRWHVMGAIQSGGLALSWLLDLLAPPGGKPPDYDTIAGEASLVAPGSDGLIFLPYLLGERTPHMDPQATAGFFGLRLHHTRAHMARAVMEGVAFALRDGLEVLRELGIAPTEACLAGGGAGIPVWREIQRDVFNMPVRVSVPGQGDHGQYGAAYGAALLAALGTKAFASPSEALTGTAEGALSEPNSTAVAIYESAYARYKQLYPALRGI